MRHVLALLLVFASSLASADPVTLTAVTGPSEQLVRDTQRLDADIEAAAPAATISADQAAVATDTTQLAIALGVASKTTVLGRYRLDFSLGGGVMGVVAFPATSSSVSGGAAGCVIADLGFASNTAAPGDRYHLILPLCLGSASAAGKTAPAVFLGLGPAVQFSTGAPELGFAAGALCPTAKGTVIQQVCMFSVSVTAGLQAGLTSVGVGTL